MTLPPNAKEYGKFVHDMATLLALYSDEELEKWHLKMRCIKCKEPQIYLLKHSHGSLCYCTNCNWTIDSFYNPDGIKAIQEIDRRTRLGIWKKKEREELEAKVLQKKVDRLGKTMTKKDAKYEKEKRELKSRIVQLKKTISDLQYDLDNYYDS